MTSKVIFVRFVTRFVFLSMGEMVGMEVEVDGCNIPTIALLKTSNSLRCWKGLGNCCVETGDLRGVVQSESREVFDDGKRSQNLRLNHRLVMVILISRATACLASPKKWL